MEGKESEKEVERDGKEERCEGKGKGREIKERQGTVGSFPPTFEIWQFATNVNCSRIVRQSAFVTRFKQ